MLFRSYKISYVKRQKEDNEMDIEPEQEVVYTGKRRLLKIFNTKLSYLFKSPEQSIEEKLQNQDLEEQLKDYSEEKKEVYASLRQDDNVELKKKNSRGIIFALVVVLVIWIINTIGGYTS